jgi:hypothetical protein
MGKQHETIPNEPQEAPVQAPQPEVQQPHDPNGPSVPQEAPNNEPVEIPQQPAQQPEIRQDDRGSELNQTEV